MLFQAQKNNFPKKKTVNFSPKNIVGFTLIELLISILILSVLLSIGLPSFVGMFDKNRLVSATEQVYSHLQQARMESIARSTGVSVRFSGSGSTNWLYGVSTNAACDLSKTVSTDATACSLVVDDGDGTVDPGDGSVDANDLVLMRFLGTDYKDVKLTLANFSNGSQINFDPMRGLSDSGDISLAVGTSYQLKIKITPLGMVKICSPNSSVGNYSATGC